MAERTSSSASPRLTRRQLIGGLGAALASIPLLWSLDVPARVAGLFQQPPVQPPTSGYVDRDGWMLAPEDVAAFEASAAAQVAQ